MRARLHDADMSATTPLLDQHAATPLLSLTPEVVEAISDELHALTGIELTVEGYEDFHLIIYSKNNSNSRLRALWPIPGLRTVGEAVALAQALKNATLPASTLPFHAAQTWISERSLSPISNLSHVGLAALEFELMKETGLGIRLHEDGFFYLTRTESGVCTNVSDRMGPAVTIGDVHAAAVKISHRHHFSKITTPMIEQLWNQIVELNAFVPRGAGVVSVQVAPDESWKMLLEMHGYNVAERWMGEEFLMRDTPFREDPEVVEVVNKLNVHLSAESAAHALDSTPPIFARHEMPLVNLDHDVSEFLIDQSVTAPCTPPTNN